MVEAGLGVSIVPLLPSGVVTRGHRVGIRPLGHQIRPIQSGILTRKGDTLEYSAVVEDPAVLAKPFNVTPMPQILHLGGPKDIFYNDDLPCDPHDFKAHADHENHL